MVYARLLYHCRRFSTDNSVDLSDYTLVLFLYVIFSLVPPGKHQQKKCYGSPADVPFNGLAIIASYYCKTSAIIRRKPHALFGERHIMLTRTCRSAVDSDYIHI